MKVLIVSDTHKKDENLEIVLDMHKPIDMLIHCGDAEGKEGHIQEICECPLYIVSGNNDFFSSLPPEIEFEIGDKKVFLTHGHHYYVSMGLECILDEAKRRNAEIVFFGHTHKPRIEIIDGVTIINPGSLSYPRQDGKIPTYIVMEIDEDGIITYMLEYLEK